MLPNTKFLHSFGLTYVAYFWFDLFNSHHKQMGKLELNCDQIRKFYIMLMGGWGVNLVSKHRRSSPHCSSGQRRQMLSSNLFHLFPPILFISVPGEKNSKNLHVNVWFFLPHWFVCGARFVWEKLGSVLIQESCVGNNIERDTLWNISHTTQPENNVRKRINNVEVWCWNIIRGWYGWRDWI